MDLLEAMDLAKKGRGQAEADASASYAPPSPEPAQRAPKERTDEEIVPKLEPAEWDAYVDDVAMEMLSRSGGGSWYALPAEQHAKWRRLATLAILSVGSVDVRVVLRRIRGRQVVAPIDDLAGRERLAGVDRWSEQGERAA